MEFKVACRDAVITISQKGRRKEGGGLEVEDVHLAS